MNSHDQFEGRDGRVDDCEGEEKKERRVVPPQPERLKIPIVDVDAHFACRQLITDPTKFQPTVQTVEQPQQ